MKHLILLVMSLVSIVCLAQEKSDLIISRLQDCQLMDNSVVHTVKMEVTNHHDKPKVILLIQNEKITGYKSSDLKSDWINPYTFITELMYVPKYTIKHWIPIQFATWFKKLSPGETFTMYIQSPRVLSVKDLKSIVRIKDFIHTEQAEALSYQDSVVIVPLR